MTKAPRIKIRPLRKLPSAKVNEWEKGNVYFHSEKLGNVKIPLRNENGALNGVFETPKGEILEIRINKHDYCAFVNNTLVGRISKSLEYRFIRNDYRQIGIANEIFDLAERNLAQSGEPNVRLNTRLDEVVKFLRQREYDIRDRKKITKTLHGTKYDNHTEWHRIKVIGKDGKIKWLTLRVLPIKKD